MPTTPPLGSDGVMPAPQTVGAPLTRWARLLDALGLHRAEIRAWAMYDWANSAFSTTIMAAVLPIYYHDVAASTLPEHLRSAYWGYTSGIALAIAAVISPLLGAVADARGGKKVMLGLFMLLGAASTGLLVQVGEGDWQLASLLFLLGNIGFAGSNVFYDALLPFIAKPSEVDRVSTAGYAFGYIGGGVLLAVNLAWIMQPAWFGIPDKDWAVKWSFLSVAFWWVAFSYPTLRWVREPAVYRHAQEVGSALRIAGRRLAATCREIRSYKQVMLFLLAYWFYTDGIGTIIKMATIYGREIGIGSTHLIGALLLVQFVGIPATFAFGSLAKRFGARPAIQVGLAVYTGICVLGYFMTSPLHFWILAVLVALVQGGTQALSRSLYAGLVPLSKANEFFAFISISARFAGILGPLLFGVVAQFYGGSRVSILFLVTFFVFGMIILQLVDLEGGKRRAAAADAAWQLRQES